MKEQKTHTPYRTRRIFCYEYSTNWNLFCLLLVSKNRLSHNSMFARHIDKTNQCHAMHRSYWFSHSLWTCFDRQQICCFDRNCMWLYAVRIYNKPSMYIYRWRYRYRWCSCMCFIRQQRQRPMNKTTNSSYNRYGYAVCYVVYGLCGACM